MSETMTDQEQKEWDLKLRKMDAEIAHLYSLTAKTAKETRWYEMVIISGITLAIVAVAKLFL